MIAIDVVSLGQFILDPSKCQCLLHCFFGHPYWEKQRARGSLFYPLFSPVATHQQYSGSAAPSSTLLKSQKTSSCFLFRSFFSLSNTWCLTPTTPLRFRSFALLQSFSMFFLFGSFQLTPADLMGFLARRGPMDENALAWRF
jgi:hypothetical protein